MKNNIEKWESIGLLANTSNERKEFVANSLELTLNYLNGNYSENDNEKFETMAFPIITRIANEIDFNINEYFSIINQLMIDIKNMEYNGDPNIDHELIFCKTFCNGKIKELKETKKNTKENEK